MNQGQVRQYLRRIGLELPSRPNVEALLEIQEHHIYAIPFENLDIIEGRLPLSLEVEDLFRKIVVDGRGGICYELNILLAELLRSLGFGVRLMAGRHPKYNDDFDHAFMLATVPGQEGEWLVDAGYAYNFRAALRFQPGVWQSDGRDEYMLAPSNELPGYWALIRRHADEEGVMYTFPLIERGVQDYQARCDWYCTSEQSRFTRGPLVCVERPGGRISLTMNRIVNTHDGTRVRDDVEGPEQFEAALRDIFGIFR